MLGATSALMIALGSTFLAFSTSHVWAMVLACVSWVYLAWRKDVS